ncbi:M56 family metallopeptidase [Bacillus sp. FJAT-22090]|uniref:M56 family metallopeptidase n=1 Tax=Bacillus sp. FJAT-22090 TaxID=1581038 RepID=UPI0011A5BB9B|nr:M56 family metallopeptidase [Bacillus sp. FJAT-22090]
MSKRQASIILIISLVISGTVFLQMALYVISMLAGWNVKFNLVVACHSWMKAIGLSSLEYALDALVIFTLAFSIWHISTQLIQTSRMKKRLEQYKENTLTKNMNQAYCNKEEDLIIISHPTPIAITMGFICPKIIISTGLISLLTDEELTAVIAHEMYHQEKRDPLKVFLLSLCASTMGYIPILKWLNKQYRIMQEVLADDFAIKKQETSVHIGSALLKMIKIGVAEKMPYAYVSFADTSINYRIEYILNPLEGIQFKIPLKIVILSLIIFSLICVFFIYALIA